MKTVLVILALVISAFAAESGLVSTTASMLLLTQPAYHGIIISDWMEITSDAVTVGHNISFAGGEAFAPQIIHIAVKHKPIVTKKPDGTWEITFKAAAADAKPATEIRGVEIPILANPFYITPNNTNGI